MPLLNAGANCLNVRRQIAPHNVVDANVAARPAASKATKS
jgi:hypothetical protein